MRTAVTVIATVVLTVASAPAEAEPPASPMVSVIVTLRDQASLTTIRGGSHATRLRMTLTRLQAKADSTQGPIRAFLATRRAQGRVASVKRFWIFNGLAVTATPGLVAELAARADVASVRPNASVAAPAPIAASAAAEVNIARVNAAALWQLGFRGQGVVVASMDTGVDLTHPDLSARWRGGTNSWFDPNGEHPNEPFDPNGHGTWTMGVMVGGDSGGTAIGMAPEARWVAVKIFNDRGVATVAGIHAGFQWLLDPDGEPASADAPDVVNNSWAFAVSGCDLEFEPDLEALRAGGIVPVFAAGNLGPSPSTSVSPANNPAALAVGATDEDDSVFSPSSRGPSACGDSETVYPELVAPGVDIRTADLFDGYRLESGTSLAAPHVAGALALLLSAFPDLSADEQGEALLASAVDLGAPGPDGVFGHGRLDVLGAYERLAPPTPSPVLYLSPARATDGIPALEGAEGEDVLGFDGDGFELAFDGSDVAPRAGLDAVSFLDAQTLLLSFDKPLFLAGIGRVDDSDVVRFDATSLGSDTAGRFTMYFDGSDVGLRTPSEDVDSVQLLADGRLLLSTLGRVRVRGVRARGHDLLAFAPESLGTRTKGTWALAFDGSDVGLTTPDERVDGAVLAPDGSLFLTTIGNFSVAGVSGDGADVFVCEAPSLGPDTACSFRSELFFAGSSLGLGDAGVDALSLPPALFTGSGG
jgi:subtilisin family serine protease